MVEAHFSGQDLSIEEYTRRLVESAAEENRRAEARHAEVIYNIANSAEYFSDAMHSQDILSENEFIPDSAAKSGRSFKGWIITNNTRFFLPDVTSDEMVEMRGCYGIGICERKIVQVYIRSGEIFVPYDFRKDEVEAADISKFFPLKDRKGENFREWQLNAMEKLWFSSLDDVARRHTSYLPE